MTMNLVNNPIHVLKLFTTGVDEDQMILFPFFFFAFFEVPLKISIEIKSNKFIKFVSIRVARLPATAKICRTDKIDICSLEKGTYTPKNTTRFILVCLL